MDQITHRSYRFFRSSGHTSAYALKLARAERLAFDAGVQTEWSADPDADLSFLSADERSSAVAESCLRFIPCDDCADRSRDCSWPHYTVIGSLSGIVDADSTYRRVVEAEIALEYFDVAPVAQTA